MELRHVREVGPRSRAARGTVAAACGFVGAVAVADALLASSAALIGLVIAAPLVCGLTATVAGTRTVGALAVAVAALAFLWDENLGSWTYWVPLAVVLVSAATAWRTATYRERLARDAQEARLLAHVGEVAERHLSVRETAQAITEAVVPGVADLCVIDRIDLDGTLHRVAGALNGDPDLLEAFLDRPPSGSDATADAAATVSPHATQIVPDVDDRTPSGPEHDENDVRLLQGLAVRSAVTVPLVARERPVGVLTLGVRGSRDRLDESFAPYAERLAQRVALALDNAVLATELASAERQLQSILATVDAAIMVRDVAGRLVYANQSAADLLKLPDVEAVRAATSQELMGLFDVYTEEGAVVDLADLPGTRVLRGDPAPTSLVVRNVVRATGEERWLLNRATAIRDDDGNTMMAVNLIEDVSEVKRAEVAQRLLAEAARQVTEASDLESKVQAVVAATVPRFADWASADLVDPHGRLVPVAVAHRDPERVRLGWHLRRTWPTDPDAPVGVAAVVRTGDPQVITEINDDLLRAYARDDEHLEVLRTVGLTSTLVVPLRAGDEVLGALSFVSSTSRRFDERDLRLAVDLGRQTGAAVRAAQLNDERARIASTLESGLMPDRLPDVPGWSVSSAYRAAGRLNQAGGDFYDIVRCGTRWAALVGDVVGKGPEAAAVTALVRHTIAAVLAVTDDPAIALAVLNRRLVERTDRLPTLCTIIVLVIGDDDEVKVFSAGHPLPVLHQDGGARVVGRTSPMLGVQDGVHIAPETLIVRPGDRLLLYTDGVLDALGAAGRFGEARLLATVDGDVAAQPAAVMRSLEAFASGDQVDDIAMIGLTRVGAPTPATAR